MKESVAIAKEADRIKKFSPTKSDKSISRVRNEPEKQLGTLRSVIDNIRRNGGMPSVDSIATELSSMHDRLSHSRGGGQPLPEHTMNFMGKRFGVDFSGVRVHTDSDAVKMSNELNALAFTHGRDIYFGAGRYNPTTPYGKKLLAHELTHVIQQRQACTNPNVPAIQRKVFRCCREVRTGRTVMDTLAGILGLEHCWLNSSTHCIVQAHPRATLSDNGIPHVNA